MTSAHTYPSRLYQAFRSLEDPRPGAIIRFFEQHESHIRQLHFDEYLDILTAYADALFAVGAYAEHRLVADEVIEQVVQANIGVYQGKDLFYHTLFRKAASCYHTHHFAEAAHILRELIKISPSDRLCQRFLHRCLFRQYPHWIQTARGLSIFFILWSTLITVVELLWVRPLYPQWISWFEHVRLGLILAAALLLAAAFGWHYLHAGWQAHAFAKKAAKRKAQRRTKEPTTHI